MTAHWAIGASLPRREDIPLLTGQGGFLADRPTDGHAWMAVVRSKVAHGVIEAIDCDGARRTPGFLLAITAADLPRNGPLPCVDTTDDSLPAFQTVLAGGVVRYAGEPVVAIVAETADAAREAAGAVRLAIMPLAVVGSTEAAIGAKLRAKGALHRRRASFETPASGLLRMKGGGVASRKKKVLPFSKHKNPLRPEERRAAMRIEGLPWLRRVHHLTPEIDAPSLHGTTGNAVHTLHHRVGNPDAAFSEAFLVLDEHFTFHRVSACPMEPRGAEASVDPATGCLRIAATTQMPGAAAIALADLLGVDAGSVDYEPLRLGGGFGLKEAFYPEEVLVAFAAQTIRRTVSWRETRDEHFAASAHGRQGTAHVRIALDRDGIVTALAVDGCSDIGAGYGFAGNSPGAAMGAMIRGPYRIPSLAAVTRSVTTNKTPLNVYRGAGHPQAVLAMERMMDRAAAKLGLGRVEIRRRNLIAAAAFPCDRGVSYPGAGRIVYDSGDYQRCLDEALDAIGADGFEARRRAFEAENPQLRLGLGLAMVVELTSPGPDEAVELSVDAEGRVTVSTALVAIGQGVESALAQVLGAALGVPGDSIIVRFGNSRLRRSGGGTYASRGASVGGAAVADGAVKMKHAAIELAAEHFAVAQTSLDWAEGGVVGLPGRNAPLTIPDLIALDDGIAARLSVTGAFSVKASSFASACHAAVVSVDIETGVVAVLDYAVAHDCGTVLNPRGVDGQIRGGVMQGIGATLFEDLAYDEDGVLLTRGLLDYPLPVAANLPRFHLRHVETPSPLNPLGMKGAGEGGFTGVPAALVGAIEHALRDFEIFLRDDGPYTPCRVLTLIHDASPDFH